METPPGILAFILVFTLVLCENITDIVDNVNLALHRPAWQSSTYFHDRRFREQQFRAGLAVDGDTVGLWPQHWACSYVDHGTGFPTSPEWWALDLQEYYNITHITLFARQDNSNIQLGYFDIVLFSSFPQLPMTVDHHGEPCASETHYIPDKQNRTYWCKSSNVARYVVIQQTKLLRHLTICEAYVYGKPVDRDECAVRFMEVHPASAGLYSRCNLIASYPSITYVQCVLRACNASGNVINYGNKTCDVMTCKDGDMSLTHSNGGWRIAKLVDKCWSDFRNIFESRQNVRSTCKVLRSYENISLDLCKLNACQLKGNAINYLSPQCQVLKCPQSNLQIEPNRRGWQVFQTSDISIKIDLKPDSGKEYGKGNKESKHVAQPLVVAAGTTVTIQGVLLGFGICLVVTLVVVMVTWFLWRRRTSHIKNTNLEVDYSRGPVQSISHTDHNAAGFENKVYMEMNMSGT